MTTASQGREKRLEGHKPYVAYAYTYADANANDISTVAIGREG